MPLLLFSLADLANAQRATGVTRFYASPSGNNANNCVSEAKACRTIQAAYDKMIAGYDFQGQSPTIHLADGTYADATVDAIEMPIGAHAVTIMGNCTGPSFGANRDRVVVRPPPGKAAFWVQDGATLIVSCMKIEGEDAVAFQGRQHIILDAQWITFGKLKQAFAMTDHSIVNFGGDNTISGDMTVFASAYYLSTIRFMGKTTISRPVKISYFVQSYLKSLVEFEPRASFVNPKSVSGAKYYVWREGSFVANGLPLPGDVPGKNVDGTGRFYE